MIRARPVGFHSIIARVRADLYSYSTLDSQLPGAWTDEPTSSAQFYSDIHNALAALSSALFNTIPGRVKRLVSAGRGSRSFKLTPRLIPLPLSAEHSNIPLPFVEPELSILVHSDIPSSSPPQDKLDPDVSD